MASRKGSDSISPTVPPISTDDDVDAFGDFLDGGFDFVGNVRNDLNGLPKVVAAALFGENGFVDAAGGPVVVAGELGVREALVVAESRSSRRRLR